MRSERWLWRLRRARCSRRPEDPEMREIDDVGIHERIFICTVHSFPVITLRPV